MTKRDFRKTDKIFYAGKPGQWDLIDLPEATYLMINGKGAPEGAEYAAALGALYPLAYAIKFAAKADGADFVVPPLEATWWAQDHSAFVQGDRAQWEWNVMLRMPDTIGAGALDAARAKQLKKGKADPEWLARARVEPYAEGQVFQTLHIGPYSAEGPILKNLHDIVMPDAGMTFGKPHHEVYLSDPRRTAPEKLKTILRQPVIPV